MRNPFRNSLMAVVCLFAFSATASADNDKPIQTHQLPAAAQASLKYFKTKKVALATVDRSVVSRSYDVVFNDGTKIEFNRNGQWTDIECERSGVPSNFVPSVIRNYVNSNYSGSRIVKIERDGKETEVKLSNGLEIKFNKKYQVVEID